MISSTYTVWKDIEGYEGKYQISEIGTARSFKNSQGNEHKDGPRPLKLQVAGAGYLKVFLCKNGKVKQLYIHRLVALFFIPNPENRKEVNHKDFNKENNHVSNLEWVTGSRNKCHAYKGYRKVGTQKLTYEDAKYIRGLDRDEYPTWMICAFRGLCPANVQQIRRGHSWKKENYDLTSI